MSNNLQAKTYSLEPLLLGAGKILFLFQQLENVLELCCAFLQIKGIDITIDSLFSNELSKRNYTLGQMLSKLKQSLVLTTLFEQKLGEFVNMRNTFIHDFWVKNKIYALDELLDLNTYKEITEFESKLYEETLYVTQIFIGFHYAIGKEIASRENKLEEFESDPEYDTMKQYLPHFLSVIESE